MRRALLTLSAVLSLALAATSTHAATFQLINNDGPGEGFNDTTPVSPIGGNDGTTLGQQRLNVFKTAGIIWGQTLPSNVTIVVSATFDPLAPCDATSGVLGSAGANAITSDFPGALVPNTWYSIALANKLNGSDLGPGSSDIVAQFNSSVDNSTCLGATSWYYGYDHNEGSNVDLLAVVLHEMGHGLGFQTFTNTSTGAFPSNRPDIFARNLLDNSLGLRWDQMTNAQRQSSALNNGQLVWNGPNAKNAAPQFLGSASIVRIDSPPSVAGEKDYGTASFGPPPPNPAILAVVVLVDDGVGTPNDGCEPFQNAAQLPGKIALIERGNCNFTAKAATAQAAGAVAVIIGNNMGGPPPGLGGTDPSITIPVVSITIDDLFALEDEILAGSTIVATIGADALHLAGADANGRPRMYAPPALEPGSSVSHWDTPETPNLLMEPFINGDLTGVDLTQYAFADIGWLGTVTGVAQTGVPVVPARAFAAPNPFARATSIHFTLTKAGPTTVEIYDVRGALVKRLPAAWRPMGTQSIGWDGTDARARQTSTGIYFWRVRQGGVEIGSGRMARVN
jgi:hypothetical protein